MNRKLIRPNLADVKSQERDLPGKRDLRSNLEIDHAAPVTVARKINPPNVTSETVETANPGAGKNRRAPPTETNAEIFYYKKQIDSHTLMVIVLQDNEEIEGTIEWYDRNALKINRKSAPNILLLKHNIKYMFKAADRTPPDKY